MLTACSSVVPDATERTLSAAPSTSPTSDGATVGAVTPPAPSPTPPPTRTLGPFDVGLAADVARRITAIGPRPGGSAAEEAARRSFARTVTSSGWEVAVEPFALPQGGESANVVAWLGERPTGRHVVLGGHIDTVEGSPGANDNASGIGVLAALAAELVDERPPVPVVLVAFGAEEYQPSEPRQHHLGSEAYAREHADDVIAALSIDMVANGQSTCICWFDAGPSTLATRLDALAPDVGFHVRAAGDISDHGPFARRGVPAALLWTGRDDRYHSPGDTAELLRVEDIRRAGELALAFVRDLRAADRDGLEPG